MVRASEAWEDATGYGGIDSEISARIRAGQLGIEVSVDLDVTEKAIRVALGPFSLSDRGRIVSDERVVRLLDLIRETGLPLKEYYSLSPEERWEYLQDTRGKLRNAVEHFPGLLGEINVDNAEDYLSNIR